jgi:hypothetical protein
VSSAALVVIVYLPPPPPLVANYPVFDNTLQGSNYTFSVFEVLTAMLVTIQVFWSVEPCRCFEREPCYMVKSYEVLEERRFSTFRVKRSNLVQEEQTVWTA